MVAAEGLGALGVPRQGLSDQVEIAVDPCPLVGTVAGHHAGPDRAADVILLRRGDVGECLADRFRRGVDRVGLLLGQRSLRDGDGRADL